MHVLYPGKIDWRVIDVQTKGRVEMYFRLQPGKEFPKPQASTRTDRDQRNKDNDSGLRLYPDQFGWTASVSSAVVSAFWLS